MSETTNKTGFEYATHQIGKNQIDCSLSLSVAERLDLDTILDPDVKRLVELERTIPVVVGYDKSVRPKILDKCGMTCVFCHNEGTPVATSRDQYTRLPLPTYGGGRVSVFSEDNGVDFLPGTMEADADFLNALITMRDNIGVDELHLTGGEPTLHPRLSDIISSATAAGFKVKMTSNGENGSRQIADCAAAGLEKINFSIFGTTPEELAAVQHQKYANIKLAEVKINALHASIQEALLHGIKVDANIVMSEFSHAERVARIIEKYGKNVSVRILNDLDAGDTSYFAIYQLLSLLNAVPVEMYVEAGTSNARIKYDLPDGTSIYFKQIRRTTMPNTCDRCTLNNDVDCKEGYYGMRLYIDTNGKYKVGVCLQRMDLTKDLDDFMSSDTLEDVVQLRRLEYITLTEHYSDRIKGVGNYE